MANVLPRSTPFSTSVAREVNFAMSPVAISFKVGTSAFSSSTRGLLGVAGDSAATAPATGGRRFTFTRTPPILNPISDEGDEAELADEADAGGGAAFPGGGAGSGLVGGA